MPHPNFAIYYPRCAALGLVPVVTDCKLLAHGATPGGEHAGADEELVLAKLGATRFAALMKNVKSVFSARHRLYPAGHTRPDIFNAKGTLADLGGYEAFAIYFDDIEKFLASGG